MPAMAGWLLLNIAMKAAPEVFNKNLGFLAKRVLNDALPAKKTSKKTAISHETILRAKLTIMIRSFIIDKQLDVYGKNGSVWVKMILARSNSIKTERLETVKGARMFWLF